MRIVLTTIRIFLLQALLCAALMASAFFMLLLDSHDNAIYGTASFQAFRNVLEMPLLYPSKIVFDMGEIVSSDITPFANLFFWVALSLVTLHLLYANISPKKALCVRWHIKCLVMSLFAYTVIFFIIVVSVPEMSRFEPLRENGFPMSIITWPFWRGVETPLGPFFAFPYALAWGYGLMYFGRWIWRRFLRGRFSRGGAETVPVAAAEPHEGPPKDDA